MILPNALCRQIGNGTDLILMLQGNTEVSSQHLVEEAGCAYYRDSQTVKFCRLGMLCVALAKHLCRPHGNCGRNTEEFGVGLYLRILQDRRHTCH